MAADVHVLDVLAAAMRWPVLLPFGCVLLVVLVWWLPRLLVGLLTRATRRYVRSTSSGSTQFAANAAGEQQTGDRSRNRSDFCSSAACCLWGRGSGCVGSRGP
jgi:hypothetical protein